MACKLTCPKCKSVLKQQYDAGKKAQGEYTVHKGNNTNYITCLVCEYHGDVMEFIGE